MTEHTAGWQTLSKTFLTLQLTRKSAPSGSWSPSGNGLYQRDGSSPNRILRKPHSPSIYAVDDVPRLTELYTNLLETSGYVVTTFNDRGSALKALAAQGNKPSLLITDYIGLSMPIDDFIGGCRALYPDLPILMASGFHERDMRPLRVKPNRFIQKPFTPEELRREVVAALNGEEY